ncbi:MAG: FAD-dependent oxidoreductase [Alkalispirochaeta sp.]
MIHRDVEILIIGAGTSGVAAAITALRRGRSVALVEPTPWIGGMLTAAGVSATDGNHMLPSGLWEEFRARLRAHYGGSDALATGWISRTLFEPEVGERILREMLRDAAGEQSEPVLIVEHQLERISRRGSRLVGATFTATRLTDRPHAEVTVEVHAQIVIAADEYGDTIHAAGLPTRYGLEGRAVTGESAGPWSPHPMPQDLSYVATVGPIELSAVHGSEPLPSFPRILDDNRLEWREFFEYAMLPGGRFMLNWPIYGNDVGADYLANPTDRSHRSRIFQTAKHKTLQLLTELHDRFPNAQLTTEHARYPTRDSLPPLPYIREARRFSGMRLVTVDALVDPFDPKHRDLLSEAVAVGNYPLDHHRREDPTAPQIEFPAIPAFSIPLGALIGPELENLIVAEKSISVSGMVNGATRLQPVTLLVGQAAGTAACVALDMGCSPQVVPVREVQRELITDNAMLMPYTDAPPQHPDFLPLQWAGVLRLLQGEPRAENWENHMLIRPHDPARREEMAGLTLSSLRALPPEKIIARAHGVAATHLVQRLGARHILHRLRRSQAGTMLRSDAALRAVLTANDPSQQRRTHTWTTD